MPKPNPKAKPKLPLKRAYEALALATLAAGIELRSILAVLDACEVREFTNGDKFYHVNVVALQPKVEHAMHLIRDALAGQGIKYAKCIGCGLIQPPRNKNCPNCKRTNEQHG